MTQVRIGSVHGQGDVLDDVSGRRRPQNESRKRQERTQKDVEGRRVGEEKEGEGQNPGQAKTLGPE